MSPGQSTSSANDPREIAITNSTSTLFLGNRSKSWMVSSPGSNTPKPQRPAKAVKPSQPRLDTHSATNIISSTQSKVTRDDWSSSTNGEDWIRTSDAEAEPAVEHQPTSTRTASEAQSASVASQTEAPQTSHSSPAETKSKASMTKRRHEQFSFVSSPALNQTQMRPVAPPTSTAPFAAEELPRAEASPAAISSAEQTSRAVQNPSASGMAAAADGQLPSEISTPAHLPTPPLVTTTSRQPHQTPMNPALSGLRPRLSYGVMLYNQADIIRRADGQSDLDVARIKFLIEACEMQDSDALLLHQIYMIYSLKQPTTGLLVLADPAFNKAFDILKYVLGNNDALTPSLARFFLDFPTLWPELYQPTFQSHLQRMRLVLTRLAGRWDQAVSTCTYRGVPFSPAEIQNAFGLASPRIQIAIFTAMLHRMGILPSKLRGPAAVRTFTEFQQKSSTAAITPNINYEEWRQLYVRAMQASPASSTNPRSGSTMSPAQASPSNPSYVSRAALHHAQGQQGLMGDVSAPNAAYAPPAVLQSYETGTYQAPAGSWQQSGVGAMRSNYLQQAAPQQQGQPPTPDPPVRQYHGPVNQRQQPQQAPQIGSIQQQHMYAVNGTFNQSLNGPQMGTFVHQQQQSRAASSSQNPRSNARNQPVAYQAPSPVHQQTQLLPRPRWIMPQAVHPNPDRIALHQAHLRSPIARIVDLDNKATPNLSLYQVVTKLDISPQRLDETTRFITLTLDIPRPEVDRKLIHAPPPHSSLTMGSHLFKPGALRWRLKCVARPVKNNTTPSETEFCASPTTWPEHLFASFNQLDDVLLRRKTHYGRDLPSDLTDSIVAGPNTLAVSFDPACTDKRSQKTFFLAVERVELFSHEHILANIKTITRADALTSILEAMKGKPSSSSTTTTTDASTDDDNDDLTITNPTISIDVADPFTSILWQTPVRTLSCKHRECFDLKTFLSSRPKSQLAGPAGADDWKCPHCQRDARPGQLVRDGFLEGVRVELVDRGLGEVKAVLVREDGGWEAKGGGDVREDGVGRGESGTPATPGVEGGVGVGSGSGNENGNGNGNGQGSRAASVSTSADVIMVLEDDDD